MHKDVGDFYKTIKPVIETANIKVIVLSQLRRLDTLTNHMYPDAEKIELYFRPDEEVDFHSSIYVAKHAIKLTYDSMVDGEDVLKIDVIKTSLFDDRYSFKTQVVDSKLKQRSIDHLSKEINDLPYKGSITTIMGLPMSFKTTVAIQTALNSAEKFEESIVHYDLEGSTTHENIQDLAGDLTVDELRSMYTLKHIPYTIRDLQDSIIALAQRKLTDYDKLKRSNGDVEFIAPSYVIIDNLGCLNR